MSFTSFKNFFLVFVPSKQKRIYRFEISKDLGWDSLKISVEIPLRSRLRFAKDLDIRSRYEILWKISMREMVWIALRDLHEISLQDLLRINLWVVNSLIHIYITKICVRSFLRIQPLGHYTYYGRMIIRVEGRGS